MAISGHCAEIATLAAASGLSRRILDVFLQHEQPSVRRGANRGAACFAFHPPSARQNPSARTAFACRALPTPAPTIGPRVMLSTRSTVARTLMWAGIACAATGLTSTHAAAEALLLIEA